VVKAKIYLEGGGDSKELHVRCQQGFRELFEKSGFKDRMPRFIACGGRNSVYGDFCIAVNGNNPEFIAMLIDSEGPLDDINKTWDHLTIKQDKWDRPQGATNEQVLFMTTCMETWIVADRDTLRDHYGQNLQESALPAVNSNLENLDRHNVQKQLRKATENCSNFYKKGKRSFIILGKLNPEILKEHLRSFTRTIQILQEKL